MRRRLITKTLLELAKQAKQRTAERREILKQEYRIYRLLNKNYMCLKHLYTYLELEKRSKIFIKPSDLRLFYDKIYPIVEKFNPECTLNV